MLIETTGWSGLPLFVAKEKIIFFGQSINNEKLTSVFVSCETASEEWILYESVQSFRAKYVAAQAEESSNGVG